MADPKQPKPRDTDDEPTSEDAPATELSDDQAAKALRKIGELEDKLEPRG